MIASYPIIGDGTQRMSNEQKDLSPVASPWTFSAEDYRQAGEKYGIGYGLSLPKMLLEAATLSSEVERLTQLKDRANAERADAWHVVDLTKARAETAEREVERLHREALGESGRCPKGHHGKFTFELEGELGCVACERHDLKREVERLKRQTLVDDLAFASANSLCVDATMRADKVEAENARLRKQLTAHQQVTAEGSSDIRPIAPASGEVVALRASLRALVEQWRLEEMRERDDVPDEARKLARCMHQLHAIVELSEPGR